MKRERKIFSSAFLLISITLILTSCGGGGGGGSSSASAPPFIAAEVDSFPTGSVPPGLLPNGFNSIAFVSVTNDNGAAIGVAISNATIIMNGVTLTYNATNQDYEGNLVVRPGGSINLSVTVGGNTYTTSGTQFTSYPTISTPMSAATWTSSNANTVTWTGGAPTTNAEYALGILDAADPRGNFVWPLDNVIQTVPIGMTSYTIPAANITAGNRLVLVGIITGAPIPIPNAAPGSGLVTSGVNYVPITISGMPVTKRTSGTTNSLYGVTWSGTQFVAVGAGGIILTSLDGSTWTGRASGTTNSLYGVTWSGTQFVALGGDFIFGASGGSTILTSPDGINWTSQTAGTTNCSNHSCILRDVVWSGTTFVAVGDVGTILTSGDGVTWTSRTSGSGYDLHGVNWSGTQFVVVGLFGSSPTVLNSPDGVTWTQQISVPPIAGNEGLSGVTWSGTQFIAVGGVILSFPNGGLGTMATLQTSGTTNFLDGVTWSGTQFVAVGAGGIIVTSPDGVMWTLQASGTTNELNGVVWSGTEFVKVGAGGTILTSP